MASINLKKVAINKNLEPITINIEDQEIIVKQYVSIIEKADAIGKILDNIFTEEGIVNTIRKEMYIVLTFISLYTNIAITDSMWESIDKTYDLIIINNIYDIVKNNVPESEFNKFIYFINNAIKEIRDYNNSFVGMAKSINQDYSQTQMDIKGMVNELADPDKVGLVKDVLDKIG